MLDSSYPRVQSIEPLPQFGEMPLHSEQEVDASASSSAGLADILVSLRNLIDRRWRLIVPLFVVTTLAIGVFGFVLPTRYTAEAFVRLDPGSQSALDAAAPYGRATDGAYIETEINEMLSRPVAEAVVKLLDLEHAEEFAYHPSSLAQLRGKHLVPTETERFDAAVDAVSKELQVYREGGSYRIAVRFSSHSPVRAAQITNAFVEEYLERSRRLQSDAAADQAKMLNDQLQHLAESVRGADDDLAKYRAVTGLARTAGSVTGTVNDQQISYIASQVAAAEASAANAASRAEGAKHQAAAKGAENVAEVLASPVITELRRHRAEVVQEQGQILHDYGPLHPAAVRNAQQLSDLDQQIAEEAQRIISGLESSAHTADATARNLRQQLQTLQTAQSGNLMASVHADSLERDAAAKRSTYERMAQAAQQIGQGVTAPPARISSSAPVPHVASFPKKFEFLAAGALLGILLGLASAYIADVFDHSVRQPQFFTDTLGIALLGTVPALSSKEVEKAGVTEMWDYTTRRPRSVYTEALRGIRAGLLTNYRSTDGQIICVTSALPHEGKSTFALSLARVMAMCGDKVILIDGDRHRSSLRTLAPEPGSIGVLEILRDKSKLPQALKRDAAGLHMLLQSDGKFEGRDLIGSSRMKTLLSVLRSRYRFVIIDAPPVLAVTDACSLAAAADRTVLVAKWGASQRGAVRAATQKLKQANVQFAGGVLVQVDLKARGELGDLSPHYYHSLVGDYYGG